MPRSRRFVVGGAVLAAACAGGVDRAWAQTAAPAAPPATLARAAISQDAIRRSRVMEVNIETAMQLANACIAHSRAANPNGGATVVVLGVSGNIILAYRTDGQIPNNFDSAYNKAKTALYMRQPSRVIANRWGAPEPALARAPLDLYLVEGGYPIIVEELMIGAIGVGGASGGDEECGHVALTKVIGPQPAIQAPARPAGGAAAAPPAPAR
jgi:uncharacterized protein GlcG (DUF336 family)